MKRIVLTLRIALFLSICAIAIFLVSKWPTSTKSLRPASQSQPTETATIPKNTTASNSDVLRIEQPKVAAEASSNKKPSKTVAIQETAFSPEKQVTLAGKRPLDHLDVIETLEETWSQGYPTSNGWHSRVRIVKTSFKSGLVRLEERVNVSLEAGKIVPLQVIIDRAMDARHVLASASHLKQLLTLGCVIEEGRSGSYLRVLIENPQSTAALPALMTRIQESGVIYSEPDSIVEASAQSSDPLVGDGVAWHLDNLGLQPGHKAGADINAFKAWDFQTDASSILIALIDSGMALDDLELTASIHTIAGDLLGDGIDNDGNGYVDDTSGYDFCDNDPIADDEYGHGTICASLIGAAGNNTLGSSGVAWKTSILNCKVLNRYGLGVLSDAIDGIDYARVQHAKILNLSWSYAGDAPLLTEALARCDAEGIVIVCASGNTGMATPVPAPACLPLSHIVAVAASTPEDTISSFSVVDPDLVDLAAPGIYLPTFTKSPSLNADGEVTYSSGTSFSAALVTGGMALGLAEFPGESSQKVIQRMLETVDPLPGGGAALRSGGRLNLGKMLGTLQLPTVHDQFSERRVFTEAAGKWQGRNDGATDEAMDAGLGLPYAPQRTLWFEWTATRSGILRMNVTQETGIPLKLAVFSDENGRPGTLVTNSLLGAEIEIPVTTGQKLFWMLDSNTPIERGITLTWQLPPTNDNWRDAPLVNGLPLVFSGDSTGATVETFEQNRVHSPYLPQGSVWWKWEPDAAITVRPHATNDHVVFILPLDDGKPKFVPGYTFGEYAVEAGKKYAIVVIPQTPAAAGPFTVTVLRPDDLVILRQPQGANALEGETAILGIQYTSSSSPSFQWYKDGEAIPFETAAGLRLSPVTGKSYGSYHVVISIPTMTLVSDPAIVAPRYAAPRLIGQTPLRSVVTGQSIEFGATFRSATPLTYQWKKNGQLLGGTTDRQVITSTAATDAGTYLLTATNEGGATPATLQVNVFDTPWKGWVNRTPESTGRGQILSTQMVGNAASAFTATEWLRSTDAGQSWSTLPMPPNMVASAGASDLDKRALVSGGVFSISTLYLTSEIWMYGPSPEWRKIQPILTLPDGSTQSIDTLSQITYFDGKWWAVLNADYSSRAIFSTDGVNWSAITDPAMPTQLITVGRVFRYDDCLAISYTTRVPPTSSSYGKVRLYFPGGITKTLDYGSSVSGVMRIGTTNYSRPFNTTLKLEDGQTTPSSLSAEFSNTLSSQFASGVRYQNEFFALEDQGIFTGNQGQGKLWTGINDTTISSKAIGFTSFAKSGDHWLVGYPDGTLWSGMDLRKIPMKAGIRLTPNPVLKSYDHEFTFGNYHSSDGAHWQLLGAATNATSASLVEPLGQAGGLFLHAILEGAYGTPTRNFMSPTMYPSALGRTDTTDFRTRIWSGEDSLFQYNGSTSTAFLPMYGKRLIKNQPPGLSFQDINIGYGSDLYTVQQYFGRWFAKGNTGAFNGNFFVTSTNGTTWTTSPLPASCVVGKNGTKLIAIESPSRAYTSADGTSWTPYTPLGLPLLNVVNQPAIPDEITSYRGYYLARYAGALYSSKDGINWALSSAPLPVRGLSTNQHTMLAYTESGLVLQPGGETESGPVITLPEMQQAVSVPPHQGFTYRLTVTDADGDLSSVTCFLDGVPFLEKTSAPYDFSVDPESVGRHAVEFVAKDQKGRISRLTCTLTTLATGMTNSYAVSLDGDLSRAILFKGGYYRIDYGTVMQWQEGKMWKAVSPSAFTLSSLMANSQAMIAMVADGIVVTQDGVNWSHLNGFTGSLSLGQKDDSFLISDNNNKWSSEDGFSWTPDVNLTVPTDTTAWANPSFGMRIASGKLQFTRDGGTNWFNLPDTYYGEKLLPVDDGFLIHARTGIYRMRSGDAALTQLYADGEKQTLYSNLTEGVVYIGKVGTGAFLRSTTNGVDFLNLTVPPNLNIIDFFLFHGVWIASSVDQICYTKDLKTWQVLIDFRTYVSKTLTLTGSPARKEWEGLDVIRFKNPNINTDFLLHADLSVSRVDGASWIPSSYSASFYPPIASAGGCYFKDRVIALSPGYLTRAAADANWAESPLYPAPGFVPSAPQSWPIYNNYLYAPTKLHAATNEKFISLRPDIFNASMNYVISTGDGASFTVSNWSGPVPLPDVTALAANNSSFLAGTSNGKTLLSTDGATWTASLIDPTLSINSILYFNGKWLISGKNHSGSTEIWSSADGLNWTRRSSSSNNGIFVEETTRSSFTAHGVARLYTGSALGWMKSTDGTSWTQDIAMNTSGAAPVAEHPLGIIGQSGLDLVILDKITGAILKRISPGSATLVWIGDKPYFRSPARLVEWTESDPRLTVISSTGGQLGVGDNLTINLKAAELSGNPGLRFHLTSDEKLGNTDDVLLGAPAWNSGTLMSDGSRQFNLPLPPTISPGRFRIAAKLEIPSTVADIALQNNQILTAASLVEIPGYELRIATSGQGSVTTTDPRAIYPEGAQLDLLAIPAKGYTFRGWSGSTVSSSSALSLKMEHDQLLTVNFTQGFLVTVKTIGKGTVSGARPASMLLANESLHLTQQSSNDWKFSHWTINGSPSPNASLSYQPTGDTFIECVFAPDFESLRDRAFANTASADRSWSGDPDGDGLTTWQELLLSSDPLKAAPLAEKIQRDKDGLRFVFTRPQGPTLTPWVQAEYSELLSDWESPDSVRMTERILSVVDGIETIEITIPFRPQSKGFFRLRCKEPTVTE